MTLPMTSNMTRALSELALLVGGAAGGALITNGFAAIMMAISASRDPVGFANFCGQPLIDFVKISSALGAVSGGIAAYGMFQDIKRRETEYEHNLAALLRKA